MIHDVSPTEATATMESPASHPGFEELLLAHQHRILHYIRSLVGNHHEAEDLLQRTNLVLWRKRASFQAGSNFHAWSSTIARLEFFSQLRRQRRDQRLFTELSRDLPATEGPRTRETMPPDTLLALRDCLRKLPSRDQELVLMRYATNKTLSNYATTLNCRPGTLKARLFKIRESLRKSIEEQLRVG
jgi:RNA polymerase sigma-70 factor (ECF subfamily)